MHPNNKAIKYKILLVIVFCKKNKQKAAKIRFYLHNSKKSSTFVPYFAVLGPFCVLDTVNGVPKVTRLPAVTRSSDASAVR